MDHKLWSASLKDVKCNWKPVQVVMGEIIRSQRFMGVLGEIPSGLRTNSSAALRWSVTHGGKSKKLLALTFEIHGTLWTRKPSAVRWGPAERRNGLFLMPGAAWEELKTFRNLHVELKLKWKEQIEFFSFFLYPFRRNLVLTADHLLFFRPFRNWMEETCLKKI